MNGQIGRDPVAIRRDLLGWYDAHRRDLPWRRTADPYRILVSEVMLQQTRVETVLPYYERFLQRFPRVEDLAAAPVDAVLTLWSGLGYYTRARRLRATARAVVERGAWPRNADELERLPGIGRYTAAAVASIAFGEAVPVVDGNVERVIARLEALPEDPKRAAGRRAVAAKAGEILDPVRPGDANQALMELGATLCRPRQPVCHECPVATACRAREGGEAERYPVRTGKARATVLVRRTVVIAQEDGRVLLFRRPEDAAVLAGTWELPWVAAEEETPESGLMRRYGGKWSLGRERGEVRHSITHRRLEIRIRVGRWTSGGGIAEGAEAGWFDAGERERLAVSSLVRKVLRRAERER